MAGASDEMLRLSSVAADTVVLERATPASAAKRNAMAVTLAYSAAAVIESRHAVIPCPGNDVVCVHSQASLNQTHRPSFI